MAVGRREARAHRRGARRAGCFIGVGLGGLFTLEKTKETADDQGAGEGQPLLDPRHHREPRRRPGVDRRTASRARATARRARARAARTPSARRPSGSAAARSTSWSPAAPRRPITPVGIGGFEAMFALSQAQRRPAARQPPVRQRARRLRLRRGRRHPRARVAHAREEARRDDLRRGHRLRRVERRLPPHAARPARRGRAARDAHGARGRAGRAGRGRLRQRARHLDARGRRRGVARRSPRSSARTRPTRSSG